jgi:hypothetical protein
MSLAEQIESAKASIRKLKRAAPYLYPEHGELFRARQAVRDAKARLKAAEKAWKELGR